MPADTSFEKWQSLGRPGFSYEEWKRSQLGLGANSDSTATIRHNGASTEPGISVPELVRRRKAEIGTFDKLPPDLADIALRDVTTGQVRKARRGSAQSALGLAYDGTSPLGEPIMGLG